MQVYIKDIILSKTGVMGAELLRHIFNRHEAFVKPFIDKNPKLVADWIAVAPWKREQKLTAVHMTDLFGEHSLKEMHEDLCMSEESVVRLADIFLHQAIQLSSPDGMRIDPWSVKCLERDLVADFGPRTAIK